jgi:hypothetical protein
MLVLMVAEKCLQDSHLHACQQQTMLLTAVPSSVHKPSAGAKKQMLSLWPALFDRCRAAAAPSCLRTPVHELRATPVEPVPYNVAGLMRSQLSTQPSTRARETIVEPVPYLVGPLQGCCCSQLVLQLCQLLLQLLV